MKTVKTTTIASALFGVLFAASVLAQSTAFTYQGRLNDGGTPANGFYDFEFSLFDVASGGTAVAGPYGYYNATVSNGLFTAVPDFGAGVFDGRQLWLEIVVQTNGGGGFTILSPRTELTAAPYAHYAPSAGAAVNAVSVSGTVPASQLSGTIPPANIGAETIDATMLADGEVGTDDLSATVLSDTFWRLDGNAGTTPGTHFLGTSDNQPLELGVNNTPGLRLQYPTSGGVPNILGGESGNTVGSNTEGAVVVGGQNEIGAHAAYAVVGGGSNNEIEDIASGASIAGGHYNRIGYNGYSAAISGGYDNDIGSYSFYSAVGGGLNNNAEPYSGYATIAGGADNRIDSNSTYAVVGGGRNNNVGVDCDYSAIGGGYDNNIVDNTYAATISGGRYNDLGANADNSAVGGGYDNNISENAGSSTIAGGVVNDIGANADYASIGGGYDNNIASNLYGATIAGGYYNSIGVGANYAAIGGGRDCAIADGAIYASAAGRRAKVNHPGTFVWADSTAADFASIADNEFAVRASGGARFVGSSTLGRIIIAPNETVNGDASELCLAEDDDFNYGMFIKYDGATGADRMGFYGKSPSYTYGPHVTIERGGGDVGIGTNAPSVRLDVVDNNLTGYVAEFENLNTSSLADVMKLSIGYAGNPTANNNFISFYHGGTACGVIDGNSSGGVRYQTTGSDFAEYLKRLNPAERMEAGDVVALVDGTVTKALEGAQRFFVVSDMACMAGNWPGEADAKDYALVAFIGQADVRVKGPVAAGDYIVATGGGIGKAVAPADLVAGQLTRLVGQAWATDTDTHERRIRAAVGLDTAPALQAVIANQQQRLERLEQLVAQMAGGVQ